MRAAIVLVFALLAGCAGDGAGTGSRASAPPDPHSLANAREITVRHLVLDLDADFAAHRLSGTAELHLQRLVPGATQLVLDTQDLEIRSVEAATGEGPWAAAPFSLGARDAILGSALTVTLPAAADRVRVRYATSPDASALQWLSPGQTAGGKQPFLFTQSQAIHARSWIPLQDSPAVRITYEARVRVPQGLTAVMAAEHGRVRGREYSFAMRQPIPSYLIALAVGELRFRRIGPRTGVYAEPPLIADAAREFEDLERMLAECERLYGPYRWGRYDILFLPPSFPYGGMENPRLTFATPTVIAGDKSLVALAAHELAHSWSGNLVTNSSWNDFWLNEGTTTYLTWRIMDAVYGKERGDMERVLSWQDLQDAIGNAERPADRALVVDGRGRNPDDLVSSIPYVRGERFLDFLERRFGRATFDVFLRTWFDEHPFESHSTADFVDFMRHYLLDAQPGVVSEAEVQSWLHDAELPASAAAPQSSAFDEVDLIRQRWLAGQVATAQLPAAKWNVQEWRRFLDLLPESLEPSRVAELDRRWTLTASRNCFIARSALKLAIRHGYAAANPALERYLVGIGRGRMILPLYRELLKTPAGRERARRIYAKARTGYHPITRASVERLIAGAGGA